MLYVYNQLEYFESLHGSLSDTDLVLSQNIIEERIRDSFKVICHCTWKIRPLDRVSVKTISNPQLYQSESKRNRLYWKGILTYSADVNGEQPEKTTAVHEHCIGAEDFFIFFFSYTKNEYRDRLSVSSDLPVNLLSADPVISNDLVRPNNLEGCIEMEFSLLLLFIFYGSINVCGTTFIVWPFYAKIDESSVDGAGERRGRRRSAGTWKTKKKEKKCRQTPVQSRGDIIDNNGVYRVFQQLPVPALYVFAAFRSDQQVQRLDARARPEQFFDKSLAHEPRAAGDEHGGPVVEVDHSARRCRRVPVLAQGLVVVVGLGHGHRKDSPEIRRIGASRFPVISHAVASSLRVVRSTEPRCGQTHRHTVIRERQIF